MTPLVLLLGAAQVAERTRFLTGLAADQAAGRILTRVLAYLGGRVPAVHATYESGWHHLGDGSSTDILPAVEAATLTDLPRFDPYQTRVLPAVRRRRAWWGGWRR